MTDQDRTMYPKLVKRMLESAFHAGYDLGRSNSWFLVGIPAAVASFAIGFLARGLLLP